MTLSEASLWFIGKSRKYIQIHANRGSLRTRGFVGDMVSVPVFSCMTVLKSGSNRLTGISLGQAYVYIRWFPSERRLLRMAVSLILVCNRVYAYLP